MKTYQDIMKDVASFNERMVKEGKKFFFCIPSKGDPSSEGCWRGALSTRVVLRDKKSTIDHNDLTKLLKALSNGVDPASVTGAMVDGLKEDEFADQLEKELSEIEGVRKVHLDKYEAFFEIAIMFDWEEILPQVVDSIERFVMIKEYKLQGGLGTGKIPGVENVN